MNSKQCRTSAANARRNLSARRADIVAAVMAALAEAGPDVTGATLILPDGSVAELSAEDVRRVYGAGKPKGEA